MAASSRGRFNRLIEPVLCHEGGLVDDPTDPGGITNWGWSLRTLKKLGDLNHDDFPDGDIDHDGDVDPADVRIMTSQEAADLYYQYFWEKYGMGRLPDPVAGKLLDLGVNQGVRQASRELQRAVRAALGTSIAVDGLIGPKTLKAVSRAKPGDVCVAFSSEAAGFYRLLVAKKPPMHKYINGWLNRAYWLPA